MRFAGRASLAAVLATGLIAAASAGSAAAQAPGQVTGLTVEQADGFATLSWTPVGGRDRRTRSSARSPARRSGREWSWASGGRTARSTRTSRPSPRPASTRATASSGASAPASATERAQPYSEPVSGTTVPEFGDPATPGENLRTGWEQRDAATFTTDVEEYAYTAALDAASERVRVVEIGRTVLGRPINMFIIGYPAPRPTARRSPTTRRRY